MLLDRGAGDENDFAMYGVDILVKYRDREPLQKLTAHHQVRRWCWCCFWCWCYIFCCKTLLSTFLPAPQNYFYRANIAAAAAVKWYKDNTGVASWFQ